MKSTQKTASDVKYCANEWKTFRRRKRKSEGEKVFIKVPVPRKKPQGSDKNRGFVVTLFQTKKCSLFL